MNDNYCYIKNILIKKIIKILYIFSFISIILATNQLTNNVKMSLYNIDGNNYISAAEYANHINSETIFNKQKKKSGAKI